MDHQIRAALPRSAETKSSRAVAPRKLEAQYLDIEGTPDMSLFNDEVRRQCFFSFFVGGLVGWWVGGQARTSPSGERWGGLFGIPKLDAHEHERPESYIVAVCCFV